jgi:hypothetical protein
MVERTELYVYDSFPKVRDASGLVGPTVRRDFFFPYQL